MGEHFEIGDRIRGAKITLQAGFLRKSKQITMGIGHHGYIITGEDNASAWIDKPFQFSKSTPIQK